jgi:hypothetical protein
MVHGPRIQLSRYEASVISYADDYQVTWRGLR